MKRLIAEVLAEHAILDNPYLAALADGSLAREDFVETQVQFYYAVVFFSRPMAVLAAKIPSSALRIEVLRNVWEEHGEGDLTARHAATFLELLARLAGLSRAEVDGRMLWPEVRAFNTVLVGATTLDDWEVGASLLGMIERMFADIAAHIGRSIVRRGWLAEDRLIHYGLHAELDVRHSDDFFALLEPAWARDERGRYLVEQGLRLGGYVFDRLYRDLWHARGRRWFSKIADPQSHFYAE